jgi:hypothetical protein
MWDEAFLFPLVLPEMSLVQLTLLDAGVNRKTSTLDRLMDITQDVILATAVLPLARVRQGLVTIPLHCAEVSTPLE